MTRKITPDGHSDAVWRETIDRLARTTSEELLESLSIKGPPRLLVVSAHPDDETLGGGRLIADWVQAGVDVVAVVASAGEACFDVIGHVEPGIAQTRLDEWYAGLALLGAQPLECLNLPDGAVGDHEERLRERLRGLVARVQPDAIAGTLDVDPHPDHQAVGRAVFAIAAEQGIPAIGWPVWLTYFADPPGPDDLQVVECSDAADDARSAAWQCFTSQREPIAEGIEAVVPPHMVDLLREQLVVVRGLQ